MIMEEYRENIPSFEVIKNIVVSQLNECISSLRMLVNSVDARIKTEKSLAGKLELKGQKYKTLKDITDIVGARLVTFYTDEIDKIAAFVTKKFDVDWENSIDKRKIYDVNQFGYMSLHYICRIPKKLYFDEAHPEINEYRFEIQIRSCLQHVWATVYHDTGYKNDIEVPKEYLRSLNRLAGLLEIADETFADIRNSLEEYRRNVKDVVNSGNFADVELNGDTYQAYVKTGVFDKLNKRIASINNMEIEHITSRAFLSIYKEFEFKTLKELDDFVKKYSEKAYQLCLRQFQGTDLDIMTSITGQINLCAVYIMDLGYGEPGLVRLLTYVYGEKRSNQSFAKKLYQLGKDMGLVKE